LIYTNRMKLHYFFPILLLTGCSLTSTPKEDRHRVEMSLHKVRTDMEDIKHDINTSDIELHILEGKLIDQESAMANVKDQIIEAHKSKIESLEERIVSLEKKLSLQEKQNDDHRSDMQKLGKHANETTSALTQYKAKIEELEKEMHVHKSKFQDVANLKGTLEAIGKELETQDSSGLRSYMIRDGDSLDKIARRFKTTVDYIKKINRLSSDMIMSGEEIYVPVSGNQ
jgi:LysM repeat protein